MPDTASARRFGTTCFEPRDGDRVLRPKPFLLNLRWPTIALKSCPKIRNPVNWLPRHGTPRSAEAVDNFVRNIVKYKLLLLLGNTLQWSVANVTQCEA